MAPNRRKLDRTVSCVDAACHVRGKVRRARISDVSHDGCRAEMAFGGMTPGDRVVIELTELLVLPATVVWVEGGQSGLEFGNPMLGAMLNEFVVRFGKPRRLH